MSQNSIDLTEAYNWLNKFEEGGKGYLRNPVKSLLTQVMNAVDKKDYSSAVKLIYIAIDVSESTGKSLEQAETHFRCGYAYYQMDSYKKAVTEYRQAKSYYDMMHIHNEAITNWMLGYPLWKMMKISNAIVEWERTCNRFQMLKEAAINQKEDEQVAWYGEIGVIMCKDLAKAIEFGQWPYQGITEESE